MTYQPIENYETTRSRLEANVAIPTTEWLLDRFRGVPLGIGAGLPKRDPVTRS